MTVLEGNFTIEDSLDLAAILDVGEITGDLVIGPVAVVELPNLRVVGGDIRVVQEDSYPPPTILLETLRLPALEEIGGSFDPNQHWFYTDGWGRLETLELDALVWVDGDFLLYGQHLVSLVLPRLEDVRGQVAMNDVNLLQAIDLDALVEAGSIDIRGSAALVALRMGSLERVDAGQRLSIRTENVATLALTSLQQAGVLSLQADGYGLGGTCSLSVDAPSLVEVQALSISCLTGTDLTAFAGVDVTTTIDVYRMPELVSLDGHENLDQELERLTLYENSLFAELSAPLGTSAIWSLDVIDNPSLCRSDVDAFVAARTVSFPDISGIDEGC